MLISLAEYAKLNGRTPDTARQMALRGGFTTAQKIGRNWVIDSEESWPDHRVKSGKYIGSRRRSNEKKSERD